jgi:hypothetical protein
MAHDMHSLYYTVLSIEICNIVSREGTSGYLPALFEHALRNTFKAARSRYENSVKKRAKCPRLSTKAKCGNAAESSGMVKNTSGAKNQSSITK